MMGQEVALIALIAARYNALADKRTKVRQLDIIDAWERYLWLHGEIPSVSIYGLLNYVDEAVLATIEAKNAKNAE